MGHTTLPPLVARLVSIRALQQCMTHANRMPARMTVRLRMPVSMQVVVHPIPPGSHWRTKPRTVSRKLNVGDAVELVSVQVGCRSSTPATTF